MVAMAALPLAQPVLRPARPRFPGPPAGAPFHLEADILARVRHAYQRDGRLAAAATVRKHEPSLSMTEALSMIDRALGLRKPSAIL